MYIHVHVLLFAPMYNENICYVYFTYKQQLTIGIIEITEITMFYHVVLLI